jgi:hypothetical protein
MHPHLVVHMSLNLGASLNPGLPKLSDPECVPLFIGRNAAGALSTFPSWMDSLDDMSRAA